MRASQGPSCKPAPRAAPQQLHPGRGVRLSLGRRGWGMRVEWGGGHGPLQRRPPRLWGCQRPFSRGRGPGRSVQEAGRSPQPRRHLGTHRRPGWSPGLGRKGRGSPAGKASRHLALTTAPGSGPEHPALAGQLYPWPYGSPDPLGQRWPILQARGLGPERTPRAPCTDLPRGRAGASPGLLGEVLEKAPLTSWARLNGS